MSRAVIVGAGIIGAACAHSLSSAGWEVTVIERGAAGGETSSHCEGNLLVSDKAPGPELDLAMDAALRWPKIAAELTAELGPSLGNIEYETKGGVVVATRDSAAAPLLEFAKNQQAAGVTTQPLTPDELLALEPDIRPDCTAGVWYPGDAQLQPTLATEALLAAARRHGAKTLTRTAVTGPLMSGSRLSGVTTTRGNFGADLVVNAAGPWAGEVAQRLGVALPVLPRRGMVLVSTRMPPRIHHKVYDGDYFGTTQSADAALQTSTVVESTPAGTVLIGSSRQRIGFTESFEVSVIGELARKAIDLFPFLKEMSLLRTYGGFRPYLPDHLPVIGPDHRLEGLAHVTGHEGAGIGLSATSAAILTALVSGAQAPVDPAPFQLTRFAETL